MAWKPLETVTFALSPRYTSINGGVKEKRQRGIYPTFNHAWSFQHHLDGLFLFVLMSSYLQPKPAQTSELIAEGNRIDCKVPQHPQMPKSALIRKTLRRPASSSWFGFRGRLC